MATDSSAAHTYSHMHTTHTIYILNGCCVFNNAPHSLFPPRRLQKHIMTATLLQTLIQTECQTDMVALTSQFSQCVNSSLILAGCTDSVDPTGRVWQWKLLSEKLGPHVLEQLFTWSQRGLVRHTVAERGVREVGVIVSESEVNHVCIQQAGIITALWRAVKIKRVPGSKPLVLQALKAFIVSFFWSQFMLCLCTTDLCDYLVGRIC